jgi:hypothetical protein
MELMNASLLFSLLACGDKETITEDTSIEVEETDTEDTDTEETNTDDTDTDSIVGTPITLNLTGATGMKIGLVKVEFPQDDDTEDTGEDSDDSFQFVDITTISSDLTNETTFTFGVETPEDSELAAIIPETSTLIGFWTPFLFNDSNGDDAYNEGEAIAGFSMTWLVYSTMDVPELNITSGWGALEMTFTEEPPTPGDIANIPLTANLQAAESLTIGGTYDSSLGNRRIAIAASATYETTLETMADIDASDPWTLTLEGEPPDNHFMDDDGSGTAPMALGTGLVYEDLNDSGDFEVEDLYNSTSGIYSICYDSMGNMAPQPVSIVYSREPTDFTTAMYSGMYGLSVGWSVLISESDVPMVITGAELNNMVIDANCVLD